MSTFGYYLCASKQEQGDMMALCELLGLSNYSKFEYPYITCPWLLLANDHYQQAVSGSHIVEQNFKAADFIKANF